MEYSGIINAAAVIGGTGIILGLVLGVAGKIFEVKIDEKQQKVRECLPGNNCGGCGFASCDKVAECIANGTAPVSACPVGGEPVAKEIAAIMGQDAGNFVKEVAYVKCSGTCDKSEVIYNYYGVKDCSRAVLAPGNGSKACSSGCLGFGSCVRACQFDAIQVINGKAVVDKEKCRACGKCIEACPQKLIELIPYNASYAVTCSSKEKGKAVKDKCKAGCIGCSLCYRACPAQAIIFENNIAKIDQDLCTGCGTCAAKCPSKVISKLK
jgi:Na+-translocating ferredoxin:NAD+ oxidoreductase RNF subunit RnfB